MLTELELKRIQALSNEALVGQFQSCSQTRENAQHQHASDMTWAKDNQERLDALRQELLSRLNKEDIS